MSVATLHLVRHGEVYNPNKVLYGRMPGYHLSDLGYQMADELAEWFAARADYLGKAPDLLVSSPLLRAQETIAPLAETFGMNVATDDRFIEAGNYFEGYAGVKDQLGNPRHWPHLINPFRPSWGEPYQQQVSRMVAGLTDIRDQLIRTHGGPVEAVVVTHQLPIWVTRLATEGQRLWHDPRDRECTLTSVTSLHFDDSARAPRVEYQEPNEHLLANAANLPGA